MAVKIFVNCIVLTLVINCLSFSNAFANQTSRWQKPVLENFSFSPTEIDITQNEKTINLNLRVSHPLGISNESLMVILENAQIGKNFTYQTKLTRLEKPLNIKSTSVNFQGTMVLDSTITPGVWQFTSELITPNPDPDLENFKPPSSQFSPLPFREFIEAESALLVRELGNLNFDFPTFVGPIHASSNYIQDDKPITIFAESPIWRVGEEYDPKKYFQVRAPGLLLKIESLTPETCESSGLVLQFTKIGYCNFKVFTEQSNEYKKKEIYLNAQILGERFKPTLFLPVISNQIVDIYPTVMSRFEIFYLGAIINPVNVTPKICLASGNKLTLYSTGTCQLHYKVPESATNFASDVSIQSFQVQKKGELVGVSNPDNRPVDEVAPITPKYPKLKKISCAKSGLKKTIRSTNPKCPIGYKPKK